MLIRKILFICLLLLFSVNLSAQWDLKRCVDYAMANNITVKISDVDAKMSDETYRQTKLSRWPSVSFNSSSSVNSGSTQNPVTYERTTETYFNAGFQLQTSADIFNFFNKQNTVAAYEWELLASKANVDKLRYDIALVVANAFLQILLAMEQEQITQVKIKQTIAQLDNTRKQVTAGTLPELSATLLEAQLAQDSVNYITAVGSVSQSILSIKSYMNIDAAAPFEIVAPPVESIPVQLMADLQPENVYSLALANQPLQRSNEYKLKAAEKFSKAAWGAKYPSFGAFGTLTSGYNNQGRKVTGITLANPPLGQVQVSGSDYLVYPLEPYRIPSFGKSPFFDQVSDNFGQNVGISMSVPLFNGGYLSSNYEKSKLNISRLQLQKQQDDQKLKQDIYQAYNDAIIALEKYNASKKGISANEKAYEIASKRYDVGMLGTYDLITAQNNLFRARLENSLNQFDYVFKLKVLEFYKGLGLTL